MRDRSASLSFGRTEARPAQQDTRRDFVDPRADGMYPQNNYQPQQQQQQQYDQQQQQQQYDQQHQQQRKLNGTDLYGEDKKAVFFSLLTLLELGVEDARASLESTYRDPRTMVQMIMENPDVAKYIIMNYLAFVVDKDIARVGSELHRMNDTQFSNYCQDHGLLNEDFFNMDVDVLLARFNVNAPRNPLAGGNNGLYNSRR